LNRRKRNCLFLNISRISKLTIKFQHQEKKKEMKFLNIVVYGAIAAAAAAVGRYKNKKRKGKRNVRGRGQKRRAKETNVGPSVFLSIVHLRRRVRLIMMRI
jgi:hypothetical protein